MMFYCWDKDPAERPAFTQLVKVTTPSVFPTVELEQNHSNVSHFQDLEALLTKETDYIDLNQFPDHAYYNEVSLSGERV